MAVQAFYDSNNTMTVQLNYDDGSPVLGATVVATVYDEDGAEAPGHTWPLSLGEVTNGEYNVVMSHLTFGNMIERKKATIVATAGGYRRVARVSVQVTPDED